MPSLKFIKNRIRSIKSTQKITKAMQMVAASKLKKAKESAESASFYAERTHEILTNVAKSVRHTGKSLLTGTGTDKRYLLIVNTSDKGLCGAFNSSILKKAKRDIDTLLTRGKEVKILCIGKKGYEALKKQYRQHIIDAKSGIGIKGIKFFEAEQIAEQVISLFEKDVFDVCCLYYSKSKSVISQIVMTEQLIPLPIEATGNEEAFEYEPSEHEILNELLPKNIAVQIYQSLLENAASEHGARMTAMDNASRNSHELIKKLNLVYNRTRQAYITKELIEIISGAEAV